MKYGKKRVLRYLSLTDTDSEFLKFWHWNLPKWSLQIFIHDFIGVSSVEYFD